MMQKKREAGYRLGTDDRQFREYIENNWKSLQAEGFKKHYFVVISSSFFEEDVQKAHELSRVTTAMPVVLLEADALMCIIEEHLQGNLDHDQIEKFLQTGILTRHKVLDSLPKRRDKRKTSTSGKCGVSPLQSSPRKRT